MREPIFVEAVAEVAIRSKAYQGMIAFCLIVFFFLAYFRLVAMAWQ